MRYRPPYSKAQLCTTMGAEAIHNGAISPPARLPMLVIVRDSALFPDHDEYVG
jgi:hypothetical protein